MFEGETESSSSGFHTYNISTCRNLFPTRENRPAKTQDKEEGMKGITHPKRCILKDEERGILEEEREEKGVSGGSIGVVREEAEGAFHN